MNDRPRQRRLRGFDDEPDGGLIRQRSARWPQSTSESHAVQRLDGKQVYVLDAHSLIYQVFHARGDMSGPQGQPVGAIHGFLTRHLDDPRAAKAGLSVVRFDPPGKTFRHEIYDQYKVNRAPMPDDLRPQIPNIQRFLEALAIPVAGGATGYEADDVLATVAWQVEQLGGECFLVTSDKDCRQLINDRVKMYNIRKNEIVDAAAVVEHGECGRTRWSISRRCGATRPTTFPALPVWARRRPLSCWRTTKRWKAFSSMWTRFPARSGGRIFVPARKRR